MIVREATRKDIPVLIDFQVRMARETENLTLDQVTLSRGVHAVFDDPAKGKYYVADNGDEIAGCLMTTYEWSDWRDGTVLWIQSVFIAEAHRRKGVFKKMYLHIRDLVVRDPAIRGIRLYVDSTNTSAQEVYTTLGMNGNHYKVFEWMNR
jgi:ribosomal protein S18 acetylase RimI-like enzyme